MILQNHSLSQDKTFQILLKFRTSLCLPCALHLNMVCFTCDMVCFTCDNYFGCLKKTQKNNLLLLTIRKYFMIWTCSKPMDFSVSVFKASCCLVMYCKSKMSLQSPYFNFWSLFLFNH